MRHAEGDSKLRILQSAKKLFAMYGYDRTTVRQICEEAGVNVALVSYHFGGKEKVFQAMFEKALPEEVLQRIEAVRGNPVKCIKLLIYEVSAFRLGEPELHNVIRQEMMMESERMGTVRKHTFPLWSMLRDCLEEGKRQRLFHFQSTDMTLMSVLGILMFGSRKPEFQTLLKEDPHPHEAFVEHATAFIFGGLGYKEDEQAGQDVDNRP